MPEALRSRIFRALEGPEAEASPEGKRVERALVSLILLNVAAVALLTVPRAQMSPQATSAANFVYQATLVVFVVEYWVRIWASVEDPCYRDPVVGRIRFALRPSMLLDLAAISPIVLSLLLGVTGGRVGALSLIMLLRLFKLFRYAPSLRTLRRVVSSRRRELGLTLAAIGIALILAATLEYVVEREAQPQRFGSIPAAMYWAMITLTTVGYGDVTPITVPGKIIAGLVALLGIGLFALPAGILSSGFADEFARTRKSKEEAHRCPHCGEALP